MTRVLGEEAGRFIQALHESHGVRFHLGRTVRGMNGRQITLDDDTRIDADFVIVGAGVRPAVFLAEKSGLAVDRGVSVNEYLETSVPGIFCRGRHRQVARPSLRRADTRRTLDGCRAAGTNGGGEHARIWRKSSMRCRSSGASTMT